MKQPSAKRWAAKLTDRFDWLESVVETDTADKQAVGEFHVARAVGRPGLQTAVLQADPENFTFDTPVGPKLVLYAAANGQARLPGCFREEKAPPPPL